MIRRWSGLARKARYRPPAAILRGLQRELRRQFERPWAPLQDRWFDERALLAATAAEDVNRLWSRLTAQPFFVSSPSLASLARMFLECYPAEARTLIARADAAVAHRFDLLGSGPVTFPGTLPWHEDFKTGRRWPIAYSADLEYEHLDEPSDVKVPWELSRCQHFTALGLAYRLTGEARYAVEFVAEVDDWIASNPWMKGVNWVCAMDVALRAISWIWGLHLFADAPACASPAFRARFLRALYLHGDFIHRHLEKSDVNGNHYLCDGVGLVFLGTTFKASTAGQRWLATGRTIVTGEILTQVHPDGVDFEKSIAYHRLALEAFITSFLLLQKHGGTIPAPALDRLHRMCGFVAAYTGPDGQAPLIGDADDGRIQQLGTQDLNDHRYLLSTGAAMFGDGQLRAAAGGFWDESFWLLGPEARVTFESLQPQPLASAAFGDGGFYVMRAGATHVTIDCGEVGMNGRGGHGHNDMLAFELVLDGTRVLTDCGSFVYTASPEWRNRFRSTSMHNTVQIDGAEINRLPSSHDLWRLHDDARPIDVVWRPGAETDYFRGSHTGYDREPYRVRHTREFVLDRRGSSLLVRDRLNGVGQHAAVWRFHFVPAATLRIEEDGVHARIGDREVWLVAMAFPHAVDWKIEPSWISPRYGVKVPSPVATLICDGVLPAEACFAIGLRRPNAGEVDRILNRFEMIS